MFTFISRLRLKLCSKNRSSFYFREDLGKKTNSDPKSVKIVFPLILWTIKGVIRVNLLPIWGQSWFGQQMENYSLKKKELCIIQRTGGTRCRVYYRLDESNPNKFKLKDILNFGLQH